MAGAHQRVPLSGINSWKVRLIISRIPRLRNSRNAILYGIVLIAMLAALSVASLSLGSRNIATARDSLQAQDEVNISLFPDSATVTVGGSFTLDIMVDPGSQEIAAVQAFLDFDPDKLQVQDADSSKSGIQLAQGATLTTVLSNSADNDTGEIAYAAGLTGEQSQLQSP